MARRAERLVARLRINAGSVRLRTTVGAAVVVGVALLSGTLGLLATLRATLMDDLRQGTELRAQEIAATLANGSDGVVALGDDDEQFMQVLDGGGHVVAASDNVEDLPVIADLPAGSTATLSAPLGDDDFVAASAAIGGQPGARRVVFGQASDEVDEAAQAAAGLLAIAAPALLVVVAATTWIVVGQALKPVEDIRREVEGISSAELHRRVTEPRSRDEIARLAATMNRMLTRLDEGQARQRRFVADASHELRSPLASIRQHAEVARAHPDRVEPDVLAEDVLEDSVRLQDLVEDLLLLARADERWLQLDTRPLDLDDVVFEEARRLRERVGARVITSDVSAARVRGNQQHLARALRNLGDNAARHAAARVALTLREDGDEVVLTVEDDGPGIPPEERTRVFERFVRLDASRTRDRGGAGLGLAIVAEIVAAHGGQVEVERSTIGGARFVVKLPRSD